VSQLKNNLSLRKVFILLAFIIASGCANSGTPSSHSDKLLSSINESLKLGKTVIVYQMKNTDKTSEQYADWAGYLNDFASDKKDTYITYPANKAFNMKLSKSKINSEGNYTVFIKKGKPTYFYDDVILEPMVYIEIDNAFSGKKLSPMDNAFLPDAIRLKDWKNKGSG